MKATIFDDNNLIIKNVIKVNNIADVEGAEAFESWHAPGKEYTINDGVREEVIPDPVYPSIGEQEHSLYIACYSYGELNIDRNLDRLIYRAQDLIKFNGATEADFPKIKALGDWKISLWGEWFDSSDQAAIDAATADLSGSYYERKAYLYQNGNLPQEAYDFAKDFSPCPHNYRDADEEMKAYNP